MEKILLIGRSGSGKSSSLRNLDPKETAIIKCVNKRLPFRKGDDKFKSMYLTTSQDIIKTVADIVTKAPHIKTIILDDIFYLSSFENFRRVSEKGYGKYTEMAKNFFDILTMPDYVKRDDITFVYITHSETNPNTMETDVKTIGKMLDSQLGVAGLFTIVIEAQASTPEGQYKFKVHNTEGESVVKTPMGLFEEDYVDNDLNLVLKAIKEYY